ncbi:unnamed protein product [Bemisia tabaci]|uniref:ceramide glucosyltransferase n=1 Tax=Bemisia tabaci TaxID=7038 RepID=A0A9P0A3Y4_BEMTA|nr:PREDICTED: ceramide glucosyltransferase [Bemisia tabaci]CAH0383655.1 unnamed protein product [Bemisia tabaci]
MIITLFGFAVFFIIFWCGQWILHLTAIIYGKCKFHKKVNVLASDVPYPGVTILKPLTGVDPNLFSNLESFFTMEYPTYELMFCIEEESDPAIMIVKKLIEKYPNVDSKIFIGGANVGVNPKINNIITGYQAAKHELFLISDSSIRMKEDTLMDMVHHMTEGVALVHQMPFTCDREGLAATVEKIFFGTFQARIYLIADLLQINCHTGMSALIRKSAMEEVGGLQAFGCYLAEDFFYAKSLTDRGYKTCVSSQPAWQNSGFCEITSFQNRLMRWTKLRIAMVPHTIILEPLSECFIIGAFTAWAVSYLLYWDPLVFYLVHILVWFLCDWVLLSVVQNGSLPFKKFDFVIGWLYREIGGPYLFLHALWDDPAIKWRSRTYKLKWGGVAEEYRPKIKI